MCHTVPPHQPLFSLEDAEHDHPFSGSIEYDHLHHPSYPDTNNLDRFLKSVLSSETMRVVRETTSDKGTRYFNFIAITAGFSLQPFSTGFRSSFFRAARRLQFSSWEWQSWSLAWLCDTGQSPH